MRTALAENMASSSEPGKVPPPQFDVVSHALSVAPVKVKLAAWALWVLIDNKAAMAAR